MGMVGVGLGKLIFGDDAFGTKPVVPQLDKIDPSQLQQDVVTGNKAVLPQAQALGQAVNAGNAQQLKTVLDTLFPGQFDQINKNISAQLRGELPTDVRNQITDAATAQSLGLGLGGTQFQVGLTGGKFIQNSLALQQQGLQNFGAMSAMAPRPFDVSSMFLTPQSRYMMQNQQNENQFKRNFAANQIAAAPDPFAQAMTQAFIQDEQQIMKMVGSVAGMAGGGGGGM